MKKLLSTFLLFYTFVFCHVAVAKPQQFYKPYTSEQEVPQVENKRYQLGEINLDFSSKIDREGFLTEQEISNQYRQDIENQLREQNIYADENSQNIITINLNIQQKRVFAGEGFSRIGNESLVGKYAHSTMKYQSTLKLNDQPLATYSSSAKISIGKKGSIGKIFRDLSGGGKPENELEDIQGFSKYIVDNLPK